MSHYLEIVITALIPDDQTELGHEGIVATKEPVHAIVEELKKMGCQEVTHVRRLKRHKPKGVVQ